MDIQQDTALARVDHEQVGIEHIRFDYVGSFGVLFLYKKVVICLQFHVGSIRSETRQKSANKLYLVLGFSHRFPREQQLKLLGVQLDHLSRARLGCHKTVSDRVWPIVEPKKLSCLDGLC